MISAPLLFCEYNFISVAAFAVAVCIRILYTCFMSKAYKIFFAVWLLHFCLLPFAAEEADTVTVLVEAAEPAKNRYVLVVGAYDWGPVADTVIMNTGKTFSADAVKAKDFEVTRIFAPEEQARLGFGFSKGERDVVDAYLSDSRGNKVDGEGNHITLKLSVEPEEPSGNPFIKAVFYTGTLYGLKIENDKLGFTIKKRSAAVCPEAARFTISGFTSGDTDLRYAFWTPTNSDQSDKKIPLIVWFHGIAEGGNNPYMPILGTKAVNLAGQKIQSYFENGAAVLVPQAPTAWLESTSAGAGGTRLWVPVDIEGTAKNILKPFLKTANALFKTDLNVKSDKENPAASVSYYSTAVKELIDECIAKHPYIDTDRIYVGGCSAGGYMTLNMLLQYPDFFAAAFPVCEAYPDRKITDSQLGELSKVPLWFTRSKDDETIKMEKHDGATVARLRKLHPEDLHYVVYDDVRDLSGVYKDKEGNPYRFDGHASWIYVLNDDVEDEGVKLFAWLASQRR
ncbi:hypothetical protein HMPREF1221_00963 [Treponema socranskii subsp. paredis ATCC 35535]|nr:hypothetical protein HMPREF1221_00963 [Treponema socranskii subsp. paredis ATCC 35535]